MLILNGRQRSPVYPQADDVDVGMIEMENDTLTDNQSQKTLTISALQVACECFRYLQSFTIIDSLIERNPEGFNIEDESGNLILHYLAFGSAGMDTVRVMEKIALDSPLDFQVNKPNIECQTPLHFAVLGGVKENVAYLVERKAKIEYQDLRGYTSIHLATDDYGNTNFDMLKYLLAKCEAAASIQDHWGRTALMHAVGKWDPNRRCDGRAIEILLFKRLRLKSPHKSIQICDNYGQTVLHHYQGRRADLVFDGILSEDGHFPI